MNALVQFLTVLAALVKAKNGGQDNDVSKLLRYGAAGVQAGRTLEDGLKDATLKVQQLVDEDRGLTDAESAALDKSIEDKLARAASVKLDS